VIDIEVIMLQLQGLEMERKSQCCGLGDISFVIVTKKLHLVVTSLPLSYSGRVSV
jgi:hypothetical protein